MKKLLLSIFCCLFSIVGYAQQDTEFWFAAPYINCDHGAYSPYRLVIFAFEEAAYVTISMPANPNFMPISVQVAANDHANIVLAYDKWEGDAKLTTPFNQKSNRGLLITSTSKIECYYQIDGDNSEAFTLKGKNALGRDFLVAGQKAYDTAIDYYPTARSSAHIVATKNNTIVEITPSCPIYIDDNTYTQEPFTITLNRGEVYSLAAYYPNAANNVMGTRIKANAPIAVTSNDDSVTADNSQIDDIGEQLLPVDFAGTEFMVVSTGNNYALCTVFALEDNTTISTSNGDTYTINKSEYVNISMHYIEALSINASKPIIVFQIMAAMAGGAELGGTILPHAECTGSSKAGYMPFSGFPVVVNLITRKSNIESCTINQYTIPSSYFYPIDSSERYYYARIQWNDSNTPFVVKCTTGIFQMGVIEGSYGGSNTYGFFSDYAEQVPMNVEANGTLVYSDYYVGLSESVKLLAYSAEGFEVTDVAWTLPNGTIIYSDSIIINEVTSEYIGEYIVTANTAMCGVMTHRFNILYYQEVTIEDTFCEGSIYTWDNHYEEDGVTPLTFTQPGTYRDTLLNSDGVDSICILQLTQIPSPILTVRSDTTINLGDSVLLWAIGADYIRWGSNDLIQTDELNYYAKPQITTQYSVFGYNLPKNGTNVVYNGNFEEGNVGFYTDCNYFEPYWSVGGWGDYTIAENIKGYGWYIEEEVKAYGGNGNMMIIDGKTSPNAVVWQQTVNIKPHTFYAFSAQVMSALESNMENQYALLQFNVDGEDIGPIFHSPKILYNWQQFYNIWYSGEKTTATLTIYNQNDSPYGNDFAIDEIALMELNAGCQEEGSVTITVRVPSSVDTIVCSNQIPFEWNGLSIDSAGFYQTKVLSSLGIVDSIVAINVMVEDITYTNIYDTICAGNSYVWNGKEYYETIQDADTLMTIYGCDSIVILNLLVLSEVPITEEYITICYGESYTWNGEIYTISGEYTQKLQAINGCDSVIILHLNILEQVPIVEDSATILSGDSYTWNGYNYTESGDYTFTLQDINGCDSVIVLHLGVYSTDFSIITYEQCADDPYIEFELKDYENIRQLAFVWDNNAQTQQLRDTIIEVTNQYIYIPNTARAGIYNVQISVVFEGKLYGTQSHRVKLLYPSSVLDQHWNDFIGVLTHDYNGGYDFVSFQWYKDNEIIPGETKSYISTSLEMGALYSALLEDVNGTKLMTCPIEAKHQTELSLYPSILTPHQIINIHTSKRSTIQLYSITGEQLSSNNYNAGDFQIPAPGTSGLYIIKVIYHNEANQVLTRKITVQ